jgi:hypothetical protein
MINGRMKKHASLAVEHVQNVEVKTLQRLIE